MFRSSTGEAWQEIMLSCVKDPSVECDPKVYLASSWNFSQFFESGTFWTDPIFQHFWKRIQIQNVN